MARKSLDNMSLDELQTLRKEVNAAIESFMDRKRAAALKAMEAVAKDHGLSLDDVIGGGKKRRKAKTVAKYRNPSDSSQTWSGRGRQPGWFKDALKGGTPAEKLEI